MGPPDRLVLSVALALALVVLTTLDAHGLQAATAGPFGYSIRWKVTSDWSDNFNDTTV